MLRISRITLACLAILVTFALLPGASAFSSTSNTPYSSSLSAHLIGANAPIPATCTNMGCQTTTTCGSSKPGWHCGFGPNGRCFEIAC